ncbi:nucleotide-diphospho-sugar transferase [Parasitella parasitica]|nr:nucleotide-diphospho-sugar transferase [Parasitella parasitica]
MVKVLILGAGYGTRLQRDLKASSDYNHLLGVPKALLPLGNKDALITHWVELFESHNISAQNDIYAVTNGQCYEAFKRWALAHGIPADHIVSDGTSTNETRLGAVPDIMFGIKEFGLLEQDVLVVGGDTLFLHDFDLAQFLKKAFTEKPSSCLVTTYQVADQEVHKFGIVETDGQGVITSFLEKPASTATKARSACPCFYLFRKEALPLIEEFVAACRESKAPKEAYDATGKCLAYLYPRCSISTFPISGRIDVGGLDSYIEANKYFEQK